MIRDIAHVVFGALSVVLDFDIAAAIIFTAYQIKQPESIRSKLGDFVEFGVGLALGGVLRAVLGCPS